jgi:DNA-binding NarL/FixJ family response regulator
MKILTIDKHDLTSEGLHKFLKELRNHAVIIQSSDCGQAMLLVDEHPDINLILLDLNFPDRDGFAMVAELRERFPAIAIVVLSSRSACDDIVRAFDLGVSGFIPKTTRRAVMLIALELVLAGGVYVPPEILARVAPAPARSRRQRGATDRSVVSPADLELTGRQIDVLALMMRGQSNKAICRALDLAEPTVKNYVTAILKVLKVRNRTEAVIVAGEMKWDLPPGREP